MSEIGKQQKRQCGRLLCEMCICVQRVNIHNNIHSKELRNCYFVVLTQVISNKQSTTSEAKK